jgi:hypothetical protein
MSRPTPGDGRHYPSSPPRPVPAEVYRRRRIGAVTTVAVVVAAVAYLATGSGGGHGTGPAAKTVAVGPAHLEVSLAGWQLPTPLSRTVAVAVNGNIDLLGGLTGTGSTTTNGIVQIDPTTGRSQTVASLVTPVHDAAGAAIGKRYFVFGGGSQNLTAEVQTYSPGSAQGTSPTSVAGQLPGPRADLAAAKSPNGAVYLAGGYDGTTYLPSVLATTDGTRFSVVGQLAVPVRYPAVAVSDGRLLVIGGETAPTAAPSAAPTAAPSGGASVGSETDDIQSVDLATGQTTVVGHLPGTLSHASAAVLDGTVFVFGGRSDGHVVDSVYKLDVSATGVVAVRDGSLPVPTSDMGVVTLGATTYLIGGEGQLGQPGTSVVVASMVRSGAAQVGAVDAAPAPFQGDLLIADRGNDRLLVVNAQKQILWTFPSATHPAPPQGFYFPDDAFFVKHGTAIITNQEEQDTIEEIAYPSGKLLAIYGHPNVAGSAPGYLNQPDDAYLLKNGDVTVADALNCRILFLNPNFTFLSTIGHTGRCQHDIPNDVAYPNGDTPLADGNFLVSEIIGSYVDEVTMAGQVVWSVKLPIAYPSDPQQIGPDLYLIADYTSPGALFEFTRTGQIVWSYQVASGEGMLNHPSLAEMLPNGLICLNDDYNDRVVIINPKTDQIVWQYGDTGLAGTAPGLLHTPDGFDLLLPNGTTPTHLATG